MKSNTANLTSLVREFYRYSKNRLNFSKKAIIKFLHDEKNAKDILGYTGNYDPDTFTISLYITNRHPVDLLRSISHELIHHWQNCNGKFKNINAIGEDYAQNDNYLRRIEKEAYEKGNLIFRDWQDMKRGKRKEGIKELSLQEAYNKRSILIGQKLLKETVRLSPDIPINSPEENLDYNLLQIAKEKLLQNIHPDDVVMSLMLKGRLNKVEAQKYLMAANNEMQSGEHVDLEENLEDEYKIGDKEELEHGPNKEKAHKVAQDHLKSDKKYYTKLKKCGLVDSEEK